MILKPDTNKLMWTKATGDWLTAFCVTMTTLVGLFIVINNWVKNKSGNKKKLEALSDACDEFQQKIKDLEKQDLVQQSDIIKLEQDYHDIVTFLLERK